MKKIICLFIIVCMCATLCACAPSPSSPEEDEVMGYVIIPHHDGDEHIDITRYQYSHGTIKVWCVDGRRVVSTNITVILE